MLLLQSIESMSGKKRRFKASPTQLSPSQSQLPQVKAENAVTLSIATTGQGTKRKTSNEHNSDAEK